MLLTDELKQLLADILSLPKEQVSRWDDDTALLGEIPEFDSMAVVSLITSLEERYGMVIDDEDITAETFLTLGSLAAFVQQRLPSSS